MVTKSMYRFLLLVAPLLANMSLVGMRQPAPNESGAAYAYIHTTDACERVTLPNSSAPVYQCEGHATVLTKGFPSGISVHGRDGALMEGLSAKWGASSNTESLRANARGRLDPQAHPYPFPFNGFWRRVDVQLTAGMGAMLVAGWILMKLEQKLAQRAPKKA